MCLRTEVCEGADGWNNFGHVLPRAPQSCNNNNIMQSPTFQSSSASSSSSAYVVHHKIGEGAFGEVLKATCRQDGKIYALKRMRLREPEHGLPAGVFRELRILQQTAHPNVSS